MAAGCPAPDELDALVSGALDPGAAERVRAHLDDCSACRVVVAHLVRDPSYQATDVALAETTASGRAGQDAHTLREGPKIRPSAPRLERIDRYRIERTLGAGGMGVVLVARDPELDRKVVIKLLRPDLAASDDDRQRLLREAQAMAKVSHAHVVPIYDVGIHDGQVFLAMEFLEGGDLASWLRSPHELAEIVDVFVKAGHGLAAAHRAGLVHRDFKPHNVLLGRDGEVKVSDFGLARTDSSSGAAPPSEPSARLLDSPITQAGAVVGTPAYMAPEQILGRPVDARADQFSFCIALYEAVYGARPFAGNTMAELFDSTIEGKLPRALERGGRVPRRVRRVLRRGLASDPAARFPSMTALLAELAPRHGRRVLVAASLAGVAVAAAIAIPLALRARAAPPCGDDGAELASVWNPQRRAALEGAFVATGAPMARASWQAVSGELERYVELWQHGHHDACAATRVRGDQTEAVMELRMQCLRRRRAELDALLDVLARPDAELMEHGGSSVSRLTSPVMCGNLDELGQTLAPPDPRIRPDVDALEQELARAHALAAAHRLAPASAALTDALARADKLAYQPLVAELHYELGQAQAMALSYGDAEQHLRHAAEAADAAGADRIRAGALTELVIVASALEKPDDAERWSELARAAIQRLGGDRGMLGELDLGLAELHRVRGDGVAAEAAYRRAIDELAASRGATSYAVADAHQSLGIFYSSTRSFDQAFDELRLARDLWTKILGPDSPEVFGATGIMGLVRQSQQRYDEAVALGEQEIALMTTYFGADSPRLSLSYTNLALSLQGLGRNDDAIAAMTKGVALTAKLVGATHPTYATALGQLGVLYFQLGRYDEAYATFARALEIYRGAHGGDDNADAIVVLNAMGSVRTRQGKLDEAAAVLGRARASALKVLAPNAMTTADTLTRIGTVELRRKNYGQAVAVLEQALAMRAAGGASPVSMSWTKLELARSLWETGRDRARAVALGREAVAEADAGGDTKQATDGRAWLADHNAR